MEAGKAQRRKAESSPQRADFEREFGKDKVKDEPDGSWSLSVREPGDVRKAYEMQEGIRRIDVEEGAREQAKLKRERVIRRDGKMVEFPEELVDRVKHRFKGGAGRNGMATPLRFSMSGITDTPVWRRFCSTCGQGHGMWRQWTKPVCDDDFTCDCGNEGDWFWEEDE